jgi:hypothetical protein
MARTQCPTSALAATQYSLQHRVAREASALAFYEATADCNTKRLSAPCPQGLAEAARGSSKTHWRATFCGVISGSRFPSVRYREERSNAHLASALHAFSGRIEESAGHRKKVRFSDVRATLCFSIPRDLSARTWLLRSSLSKSGWMIDLTFLLFGPALPTLVIQIAIEFLLGFYAGPPMSLICHPTDPDTLHISRWRPLHDVTEDARIRGAVWRPHRFEALLRRQATRPLRHQSRL